LEDAAISGGSDGERFSSFIMRDLVAEPVDTVSFGDKFVILYSSHTKRAISRVAARPKVRPAILINEKPLRLRRALKAVL